MKILLVNDKFPPEPTTVGKLVLAISQKLNSLGHETYIFTTQEKENLTDFEKFFVVTPPRFDNFVRYWITLYNPFIVKKFREVLKEKKPDIIHFHNIHQYLGFNLLGIAKKELKKPVFLTAHDVMLFHYGKLIEFINPDELSVTKNFNYRITSLQQIKRFKKRYNPFRNIIIKRYLKYVDKIFAVSNALKEALNQNGIYNVEVIHNGIDLDGWWIEKKDIEEFKKRFGLENKKIIFFGGRINKAKGAEQLLKAMAIVCKTIHNIVLLLVGQSTNYVENFIQRGKSLDVNIINTGWLSGSELKSAYWVSDIVAQPSICFDSFGMVILEAMACKKPVVGTCFGGAPEIVQDGVTGYIVNPFDVETMAVKIIDLLKNPQKARQFGEAGYERAKKHFSLDSQIAKTLAWYQKMLDDKEKSLKN